MTPAITVLFSAYLACLVPFAVQLRRMHKVERRQILRGMAERRRSYRRAFGTGRTT